jgi:hypothetical protein
MQNENLQSEIVNPTQPCCANRLSRKIRLGILGGALLLCGALSAISVNRIVPKSPNRSFANRLAWYVHQGQWHADMRTFSSAVSYIVSRDSETPSETVSTNSSIARNGTPTVPKS